MTLPKSTEKSVAVIFEEINLPPCGYLAFMRMSEHTNLVPDVYNKLISATNYNIIEIDLERKVELEFSGIKIIGLTGMSGAGKTTACRVFKKNGFFVINCDKITEKVISKNSKCLKEVAELFSSDAVNEKGELNRRLIADIIFSAPDKKADYENIVFPYITYAVLEMIRREAEKRHSFILLDAPTLFESGVDKLCDSVISIVTELKTAKERIKARDNLSDEEAVKRLSSQKRAAYYVQKSTFSIINNSGIENFTADTEKIIEKIRCVNV